MHARKWIHGFSTTSSLRKNNSGLFNYLWASGVGLWNLRWQVDGFSRSIGGYDEQVVRARFGSGSNIHGLNLAEICITQSWDDNKEHLALIALTLSIGNFEAWEDATLRRLGMNAFHPRVAATKALVTNKDRGKLISDLDRSTAPSLMRDHIAPQLLQRWNSEITALDALTDVFTHFKSLRNKLVHEGGIADALCESTYAMASKHSAKHLGVSKAPMMHPVVQGQPVRLELSGVVAFTALLLRFAAALDAKLAATSAADADFCARWFERFGKAQLLPSDRDKRSKRVSRMLQKIDYPAPSSVDAFTDLLKAQGVVTF